MRSALAEIVETVQMFTDRAERIQALIDLAGSFRPADRPKPYPEERRVPGCESEVFVWGAPEEGKWRFEFAVENPQGMSAMAMAVVLAEGLEGATAEEVLAVPDELPYELFGRELSMGKSMGLMGMVRSCKALVMA